MSENQAKQEEWVGRKPNKGTRFLIAVATISAILAILLYEFTLNVLGSQSVTSGLMLGIFSGLLTSGVTTAIAWLAYDYFFPLQRHLQFRPKVDGKWFGYYVTDSETRVVEYIYIKQVAEKVSGTITNQTNVVYEFTGEIVLGTLVLTWVSKDDSEDNAGALTLRPIKHELWSGIQTAGHALGDEHHNANSVVVMPYLLSKKAISEKDWQEWTERQAELVTFEGLRK